MNKNPRLVSICIGLACTVVVMAVVMALSVVPIPDCDIQLSEIPVSEPDKLAETPEIKMAVQFTVQADGETKSLRAVPMTIADVLTVHNIAVDKDDIVTPGLQEKLTAGTTITVQRIDKKIETVEEKVKFKTKTKNDDDLMAGKTKVLKKGKNGLAKVTYEITYCDGKEVSREQVDYELLKKPVTKVVAKGTAGTIEGKVYTKKFTVKAYSYTGGGRTASGKPAAVGRIAVDPSVIPLGTKVYVEGYGFAEACDTGGNIKGNTIDVYFNSTSQCYAWGCRYVTIYILK